MKNQDLLENQVNLSYLAIGSNLGNKFENIIKAKFELQNFKIKILKSSNNFETVSWPDSSNPKFINTVIEIETKLSSLELLKICKLVEKKLGRKKSTKNAPRLCDIDIIDYKQSILKLGKNNLILPHPLMHKRNFVLLPLFQINKSWKHPKLQMNIVDLVNSLPIKDLRSIKQI
ncbi:2-amino-4-hydroxy-6-hydroxymethyldihydropteridine diphosphokinase [Candidatus Pelagibacter bacterium]|nr:2-amino-4-hydroxy-6-hydroxymethyldihydropteridine diphosphokinase [Candidatus Pelagibacter bacterium]